MIFFYMYFTPILFLVTYASFPVIVIEAVGVLKAQNKLDVR